jgi:uncharacterized protein with PIN domain
MASRPSAEMRFYEELNDFLPEERRKRDFPVEVDRARSVKDAIESVGVPHTEVDLILVDGASVGFEHLLRGGERVAVYPMFERLDIAPLVRLRPRALRDPRFVVDGHLAKLARHLRMAGFDTLWGNDWDDDQIVSISTVQRRTILTRDKGMLRRGDVERGYFVRATESEAQLFEVLERLQLEGLVAAFTRCRECNAPLEDVARVDVLDRIPARIGDLYDRFKRWEGTHFERMRAVLEKVRRPRPRIV